MTTEEKAKAYEESLERAKDFMNGEVHYALKRGENIMCWISPELAESEDERTRKELLEFLDELSKLGKNTNFDRWSKSDCADWIIWLEKQKTSEEALQYLRENHSSSEMSDFQAAMNIAVAKAYDKGYNDGLEKKGEQKPVIEMKTPEESLGIDSDIYNKIVDECIYGEQKPIDKLEPKFHEGEWIVWKDKCYKVNYNGCGYELVDQDGLSTSLEYGTIDENAHLWDITKDAKDGDVLVHNDCTFIFMGIKDGIVQALEENLLEGTNPVPFGEPNKDKDYHPSTKEQHDFLFKKMKESGYEWDAEKKELKKINSYCQENCKGFQEIGKCFTDEECKAKREAEYKSPWSEDDDTKLKSACALIRNTSINGNEGVVDSTIDWLKSLRPQNRWKPSDEQIKALHDLNLTGNISYAGQGQVLIELYNDLKKLAEE